MKKFLDNKKSALMMIVILAVGSISVVGTTHVTMASQIGKLCVFFACGNANITGGTTSSGGGGGQPTPTTGKLTVIKEVDNTRCPAGSGFCKAPSDFQIKVTATNVSPSTPFPGSTTGTDVTLDAGSYTVEEVPPIPFGYFVTFKGQCTQPVANVPSATGTIAAGETQTCTVVNTFTAA